MSSDGNISVYFLLGAETHEGTDATDKSLLSGDSVHKVDHSEV
jgi:hypothetical protein